MKKLRYRLLALALVAPLLACGGDPCKKVEQKICEKAGDQCETAKKAFNQAMGMLPSGDLRTKACEAALDNIDKFTNLGK